MRNPKAEQGKFQSFIQGTGDEKINNSVSSVLLHYLT